jgi:threonine synthase
LDDELTSKIRLSSANSINIARLIPQSFYYFEAYKQLDTKGKPVVFSVPSGNFGNLTAGLFAKKMGLPVHQFIAATNANDVVPQYLASGEYKPVPSVRTLSNAMDVGNPSNFARMLDVYGSTWKDMVNDIKGYSYNDEATKEGVKEVFSKYNYIIDPHGAVGYLALKEYQKTNDVVGVVLETAHPTKFLDDMESILEQKIPIPERLASLADKKKESILRGIDFESFKDWLLKTY